MNRLLIVLIILSIIELAFYLALPFLLHLRGVDARRKGPFGLIMVFETPDEDGTPIRLLNVNGVFQSATYLSDDLWSELVCQYHRYMIEAINELGSARTVLVIGGGGYSLPKYLMTHTKRMRVCVIEIDAEMTNLAREKFFLTRAEAIAGNRLELICADGFEWLRNNNRQFDVIINDAFSAGRPLKKLATEEGAQLIARHLTEHSLYLANIRSSLAGRGAQNIRSVEHAFQSEFGSVHIVPENPEEPRRLGNNVLIASKQKS